MALSDRSRRGGGALPRSGERWEPAASAILWVRRSPLLLLDSSVVTVPVTDVDREAAQTASALASLQAAVRQRQGELAAVGGPGGRGDDLSASLAELRRREFVQEPRPVSPRPGIGALIVFARRAAYHLFGKWHARAVLQQQNEFNQSVASLVAALAERERESRTEMARLRRRLEELETERDGTRPDRGSPGTSG